MIGPPDVVQPWMPGAARESDACLWHVSLVGGFRRRGCAAAGVPGFLDGPLSRIRLRDWAVMRVRRFRPKARVALFLAARGRCAACGEPLQPGWHGDHVQPVSTGGETVPANGQALCPRCNLEKGARQA